MWELRKKIVTTCKQGTPGSRKGRKKNEGAEEKYSENMGVRDSWEHKWQEKECGS